MKKYRLKLTTLTPIHIGTGEVYEPVNFVIDNGFLYEFDEVLFYQSLDDLDRKAFNNKLKNYIEIIEFYRQSNIINKAKKISHSKVEVSQKVENRYKALQNKDGSKNKNLFEIKKIYKNPNTSMPIIPGSSIKGMLDTIFKIYPPKASNELRQKLILSDAIPLNTNIKVGYSYRKHKNPHKKAKSSIPQILEVIDKESSFILTLKTIYEFDKIIDKVNEYYNQESRISEYFKITSRSFVARLGKFSGKAFMVDDGKNVLNNDRKPVATHTIFEDDSQFGWVKFELLDEKEYKESIYLIKDNKDEYFNKIQVKHQDIKERIKIKKEKKIKEKLLKQKAKEKEEKRVKDEKEKIRKELEAMNPLERKIVELINSNPNSNESREVIIFNAIKNGKLEEFKCKALELLKEEMIKSKKWVENSKKPQKDKKYKRTQEIIKMLSECE